MALKNNDNELSSSLKAIQDSVDSNPHDELLQKFLDQSKKERALNGPALFLLFVVGLGSLVLGGVIGAIAQKVFVLSRLMEPSLLLLAIAVFGGAAIFVAIFARAQRVKARRYPRRTSGVVSSSKISNKPGGTSGGAGYRINYVHCSVTYEVAGQQHTVSWKPGGSISSVERYLGRVVTVCFDPDKVDDAMVGRPDRAFLKLSLAYGFFTTLVGACICLREYPFF
jgi:hypothetical protein